MIRTIAETLLSVAQLLSANGWETTVGKGEDLPIAADATNGQPVTRGHSSTAVDIVSPSYIPTTAVGEKYHSTSTTAGQALTTARSRARMPVRINYSSDDPISLNVHSIRSRAAQNTPADGLAPCTGEKARHSGLIPG
jgi:hypothetical protein